MKKIHILIFRFIRFASAINEHKGQRVIQNCKDKFEKYIYSKQEYSFSLFVTVLLQWSLRVLLSFLKTQKWN